MKPSIAHNTILDIAPYTPGSSGSDQEKQMIRLCSNENPFGTSPKVIEALNKESGGLHLYPDATASGLREALAKKWSINADNIVCGAGSDELIALLCQAYAKEGDEILLSEHGFLMYPISALRVGATPITAEEQHLSVDVDNILSQVTQNTKIVFVANPNNPTGSYLNKTELARLRDALPDEVLLVIDAAYAEYVTADDYDSGISLVESTENTVMLRTFSKIYGLAALRMGWAYGPSDIVDILHRIRGPFNVSQTAQTAAIASLHDEAFVQHAIDHNVLWLGKMTEALSALGLTVYPSVANFILVQFPDNIEVQAIDQHLKAQYILGRKMASYGLADCMRFTIGTESDNETLLNALTTFLG